MINLLLLLKTQNHPSIIKLKRKYNFKEKSFLSQSL